MFDLSTTLLVSLGLCGVGAAVIVVTLARARSMAPDIGEFLDDGTAGTDEYARRVSEPVLPRLGKLVIGGLSSRIERILPRQRLETISRQLMMAGRSGGRRAAAEHFAAQVGLTVLCTVLAILGMGAVSAPGMKLGLFLLPVIGFMLPAARLKRAIRQRSDSIFRDLPDIIDMLAIAVEAGSGFESALQVVCQNFDSPMAAELETALQEMSLGMPRRQALQALKERTDLDVVRTFVLALVQADALGIPISRVLKAQSTEIRNRRRAWAREKAAKLPVKILFPLVLFIFPPVFAIVLGPAIPSFMQIK